MRVSAIVAKIEECEHYLAGPHLYVAHAYK